MAKDSAMLEHGIRRINVKILAQICFTAKRKFKMNNSVKLYMNDLINEGFCYGMSLEGKLYKSGLVATIIEINTDYMNLVYHYQINDWPELVKQRILLEWRTPRYGSTNAHFVCPDCGKKVTMLNNRAIFFRCHKCSCLARKGLYQNDILHFLNIQDKMESGTLMFKIWQ